MAKYRLMIEGNNFLAKSDEGLIKEGFFTTRFIEAENESIAIKKTMISIRDEISDYYFNDNDDTPNMKIEEIVELNSFGDNKVPGSGFTWFKE